MTEEKKILIVASTERKPFLKIKRRFGVVQSEIFSLSLTVSNIGDTPFKGGTINNLSLSSSDGQTIYHPVNKDFYIPPINPKEEFVLNVSKMFTPLCGPAWIQLDFKPSTEGEQINIYQLDKATKEAVVPKVNSWGDGILISSQQEYATNKSNQLLLALTVMTTWEAIFGIKNTLIILLSALGKLLCFLNYLIGLLIN